MFKISYFDGNYVKDEGQTEVTVKNRAGNLLHESPQIAYGAEIAEEYQNYVPDPPEDGYVFEGWYLDEGCTVPYPWDTMPLDGINVYAKWHLKQYRAFLHPNAVNVDPDTGVETLDPTLDWGSDDQALNFRISYLDQISVPFGTRKAARWRPRSRRATSFCRSRAATSRSATSWRFTTIIIYW